MSLWNPGPGLFQETSRFRNTLVVCTAVCLAVLFLHYQGGRMARSLPLPPAFDLLGRFLVSGAVLILVPLLTAPLLRNRGAFGLRPGPWRQWLPVALLLSALVIGLTLLLGRSRAFLDAYPLLPEARTSLGVFGLYAAVRLFYLFGWEFLFRGYMLFSLESEIGRVPAVLVQALPYALLHMGKPELEAYASFPFGLLLGLMALRFKSVWPCVVIHGLTALAMDLLGRAGA